MTTAPSVAAEVLTSGLDGLLVRFSLTPDPAAMAAARRFAAALQAAPPKDLPGGLTEIAPALVSVLVRFDAERTDRAALRSTLERIAGETVQGPLVMPDPARRWTIPVAFGGDQGPQLGQVAQALGIGEDAAVAELCASDLRVLTIGFAPGQPYIGLLPPRWDLPRLPEITPSVPAGSVVVAVRQIVLFGADSATGWQQVGRAALRTFIPDRAEPMPLQGGDAIRFARASADEIARLAEAGDRMGGARLEVLR